MALVAVVPVKLGRSPKRRLAHLLDEPQRIALVRHMLARASTATQAAGLRTIVVADVDPGEAASGADVAVQRARGLNGGLEEVLASLDREVLILPADMPWIHAAAVAGLAGTDADVLVSPTADGGTGALLLRRRIRLQFGSGSALAHAYAARRAGLRAVVRPVRGLDRDLDDEPAYRVAVRDGVVPAAAERGQGRDLRPLR